MIIVRVLITSGAVRVSSGSSPARRRGPGISADGSLGHTTPVVVDPSVIAA
jgi:hypothetical protein